MYGLRRGILKVALQPSLLRSAVVGGRGLKRIKLDRSLGTEEVGVWEGNWSRGGTRVAHAAGERWGERRCMWKATCRRSWMWSISRTT